jgi:hypothetical protein
MYKELTLTGLFLAGSLALASPVSAQSNGILFKMRAGDTNYCHLRFPAIDERTLSWDRPRLKPASSGNVVMCTARAITTLWEKRQSKLKNLITSTEEHTPTAAG